MYPQKLTSLGDHIRKARLDRGLLQKDVALAIGVSENALTAWETGRQKPHLTALPKVFAFLGYTPEPYDQKPTDLGERVRLYRYTRGMSQEGLARLLGVDETTVAGWERGEHIPSKKLTKKLSELDR